MNRHNIAAALWETAGLVIAIIFLPASLLFQAAQSWYTFCEGKARMAQLRARTQAKFDHLI